MGMADATQPARKSRNHGLVAAVCVVFVAGMVGMSFAAVALYRIFCQATGYQGTPRQATSAPATAIDRTVTVRFDANIANGLGWSFRPEQRSVTIKLGEVAKVAFIAENRGGKVSTGKAAFNVQPDAAGAYFNKIACFCFTDQTLEPGERVEMPVVFFVDPSVTRDADMQGIDTITLSYTFFPSADPAKPVAAAQTRPEGKPL
jgi:cytochrome c oxidase assembly protein subunit 11